MSDDRHVLNARIGELLHAGLVDVRNRTYPPMPGEVVPVGQVNDLADLLHNLPRYIVGHDEHAIDSAEQLRAAVIDYVRRYCPDLAPEHHRYVMLLDMDADEFMNRYRDHKWSLPEPEPVGQAG